MTGLILGTTLLINSSQAQTVNLPDSIAARVIDELIIKDYLVTVVQKQDSIITTYHHKDSLAQREIFLYTLNKKDYETRLANKDSLLVMKEKENKDLRKAKRKIWFQNQALKLSLIIEAIAIAALLII